MALSDIIAGGIEALAASVDGALQAAVEFEGIQDERLRAKRQLELDARMADVAEKQVAVQKQLGLEGIASSERVATQQTQLGRDVAKLSLELEKLKQSGETQRTGMTLESQQELQRTASAAALALQKVINRGALDVADTEALATFMNTLLSTQSAERVATGQQETAKAIATGEQTTRKEIATEQQETLRRGQDISLQIAQEGNATAENIANTEQVTAIRQAQIQAATENLANLAAQAAAQGKSSATLRQEYVKNAKRYVEVLDLAARYDALDSVANPTPISDDAMIRLYHKMLDPNSVVRESEFAGVEVRDSATGRVIATYARLAEGLTLGAPGSKKRQDIANAIESMVEPFRLIKKQNEETYTRLAEADGLDAARVVIPLTAQDVSTGVDVVDIIRRELERGRTEESIRAKLKKDKRGTDAEIDILFMKAKAGGLTVSEPGVRVSLPPPGIRPQDGVPPTGSTGTTADSPNDVRRHSAAR